MKKIALLLAVVLLGVGASDIQARYKDGYYNRMDGKKTAELKQAAKACVQNHQTLVYTDLPEYWQYSDVYPELYNGCKRWWDMYSDEVYLIRPGQSGRQSFSANRMQREHSVPKSWWKLNGGVEYTPAYSDMWNLYPSDGAANQAKLNYAFGPVKTITFNNGVSKVGPPMTGFGGGSSSVFEPADEYKGDFARAMFYMATVYDDINWVINYMYAKESYPTLRSWAVSMLLDWSRRDPVDQKEIDRNNVVEQYQGNRNPFVDFPELAEYIWGSRITETFYIDEQETSDPTPPVTGDPEITMPVNGEALEFGQTAVGTVITNVLQIAGKNLTSPLSVRVVGDDKACFIPEVTSIPAATMNQNKGFLLNIAYTPTAIGRHEAKVVLYDGGLPGGENIAVTLFGEALPRPDLSTLHALAATDVSDNSYTANWEAAPSVADYYVLTRVRYVGDDTEIETYETGETSYLVTERNPEVAESYYVRYSRLGLLSEPSNEIYVAAGSGVEYVETVFPVSFVAVEGGFFVRGEACNDLRVTNVDGLEVVYAANIGDGEFISLSPGIYIVGCRATKPVKLIVR